MVHPCPPTTDPIRQRIHPSTRLTKVAHNSYKPHDGSNRVTLGGSFSTCVKRTPTQALRLLLALLTSCPLDLASSISHPPQPCPLSIQPPAKACNKVALRASRCGLP